ncbi:hypothetical protein BK764_11025 [Bacillus thuringiensis serovar israelensis]|jgi:hypothetical protein|nr:hypothetical protein BF38_6006 [Bacillus thuringiensis]AJH02804.1 hypothetical protein AS86_6351 [Bacillus thuringiensis HD1002]AND28386.1 hypothetical protein ATN07_31545 [Bacillus thuringiensis serovar israelensis]EAO53430.1 hypothetical protein RBTH_04821 [Bacillus thuringiensis serovar israelensis ATCC 35646]EEM74787.1 hypothetical protein bthur0010_51890 [Bacillus thuringiensis serovar pondicheriensis BGSC 4BA1]EEN00076.1 hypothetical protein bthur0014_55710 [Bacillus thuringiensis IBL
MAIKQELDSLREQQAEDRKMYLEMRHFNQTRQGELLNRLRELDERDEKIRREEKREERLHELSKQQLTLSDTGKEIKEPQKEITSHVDLQVARVEGREKQEQVIETRVRKGVSTYTTDTESFLENGVEASVTEHTDSINSPKEKVEPPITRERLRSISEGLSRLKVKRDKEENEVAKTKAFNKKNTTKKEKQKKGRKKNVMKSKRIPSKEVVAFLEGVLRGSEPKTVSQLKALAEEYFNNEWTSFYDMMSLSLKDSDYIVKDEKVEGKSITYSYNENKRQQTTEEKEVNNNDITNEPTSIR